MDNKFKNYFSLVLAINILTCTFGSEIFFCKPSFSAEIKTEKENNLKLNNIKLNSKDDIEKVFDLGVKSYNEGKYKLAINIFKLIIDKFPGYADAYYYIGSSYYALGNYSFSLAYYLEAHKRYEDERFDALFGAGLAYVIMGYPDEAQRAFEKVVKESNDITLVNDAKKYLEDIDYDKLQKEKIDLLTSDINFREGLEYLDKQDYERAKESFEKSIKNSSNLLLPLYYLGNSLYLLENYDEAIDTFQKIILISPTSKIAKDADLYIRIIEEITSNLPNPRPYYIQTSLGMLYDSNLSYSDVNSTQISDIAGNINLRTGYVFNNNFHLFYNYYGSLYSGINDKLPNLDIHSYDFNLQRHTASAKFSYPIYKNLLGEAEYNLNWFFLSGKNFLVSNKISPQLNYYISPDLVTSLQYDLEFNSYPNSLFETRNNLNHLIGIYQYFYFLQNTMWLKTGYDLQLTFAKDALQEQSGFLEDGSKYNLNYQFANSLVSNSLSLAFGTNLVFNSKLNLTTKLSLNNYTRPDIYKLTVPINNITEGKQEEQLIKDINKYRSDLLYSIGFNYSIPIPMLNNVTANINYFYLLNASNIKQEDYIGRSYSKHSLGLNLTYDF